MSGPPTTSWSQWNRENLSPDPEVMQRLRRDLTALIKDPVEDIRVLVNDADLTDVQAFFTGPVDTPYAGGIFHVKLSMTGQFPSGPPKAVFLTKIFHPNVAIATGEICVNTLKKDWRPEMGIREILVTIKCLLIDPNPESALNEEAGRLLLEDYNAFAQRARIYTDVHARPPTSQSAEGARVVVETQPSKRPHTESSKKGLRRL